MVTVMFEAHWDITDKDGLDYCEENGSVCEHRVGRAETSQKTALVQVRGGGGLDCQGGSRLGDDWVRGEESKRALRMTRGGFRLFCWSKWEVEEYTC